MSAGALTTGVSGRREILSPEGIRLGFEIAGVGDRAVAFLTDLLVLLGILVAIWVATWLAAVAGGGGEIALAFTLVASFFLRNGYFLVLELHGGGATPGKRRQGIRVIARDGGPLTVEALWARNLMRELEFFLPALALVFPQALLPDAPGWGRMAGVVWLFVFACLPFFNRERRRCGDLVAGTVVVRTPKASLSRDLADTRLRTRGAIEARRAAAEPLSVTFTREELEHYGIKELQVLEDILRREAAGEPLERRLLDEIARKILKKIGWPPARWPKEPVGFLRAFYQAQRAHLEQKMLFGERKEKKSR